jgi:hypothetical protein
MAKQTRSKGNNSKASRPARSADPVESASATSKAAGRSGGTTSSSAKLKRVTHSSTVPVPGRTAPTDEQIRARAYEIYLARGRVAGDEDADWLQAERELRDEFARS